MQPAGDMPSRQVALETLQNLFQTKQRELEDLKKLLVETRTTSSTLAEKATMVLST